VEGAERISLKGQVVRSKPSFQKTGQEVFAELSIIVHAIEILFNN